VPYISLVVDELIVTERSYVKDLRDVVHVSSVLALILLHRRIPGAASDSEQAFGNSKSLTVAACEIVLFVA